MTSVYALIDPRDRTPRYVGITAGTINARVRRHMRRARAGSALYVSCWLRGLLASGVLPGVIELECVADDHASEAEREWIGYLRFVGASLTNLTDGGISVPMNATIAAKIGATRRRLGLRPSSAATAKSVATMLDRWRDPEFRRQRSLHTAETQRALWADPAHRERMTAVRRLQPHARGWTHSEAWKEDCAKRSREWWATRTDQQRREFGAKVWTARRARKTDDAGMLDVVGLDTSVPQLMADFIAG